MAFARGARDDARNTDTKEMAIARATKFTLTSDGSGDVEQRNVILEN
jgi:hypothetical protein